MGLKDCEIVLKNNNHNVYHPGETINGYVKFVFDSVKKVRGIYVTFKGLAETSWVEEAVLSKPKINVTYTGREELFNQSYYILGDVIAFKSHKIEILPGVHRYPFTCTLPSTLPTSFEDKLGFIRYTVKVTLDRPWKFDQVIKMAFTVIDHSDLNIIAELKIIVYTSQSPVHHKKTVKKDIYGEKLGFVKKYSKENWNKTFQIPVLPPTSLKKPNLINIFYEMKVKCLRSGLHQDVKEKVSIVLGTVPIADTLHGHLQKIIENDLVNIKLIHNTHPLQDKGINAMGSMEYIDSCNSTITILEQDESPLTRVQHPTPFVPTYPFYKQI